MGNDQKKGRRFFLGGGGQPTFREKRDRQGAA